MSTTQIDFTLFSPEHVDGALRLSRAAGWPHRREDWEMALDLSTGFVALLGEQVAGTAMLTPYGADAATINLVIVDEALRGRGIGRRLMQLALDRAGNRVCRLTATADGMPLYERLGFRAVGEIAQHQGTLGSLPAPVGVAWAGHEARAAIAALDRQATGLDRSALLTCLWESARFAVLRSSGTITGYAALRPFGRGEVAGPAIADTVEEAQALLAFLFAARPGRFMRVDTATDTGLGPWLEQHGLACVDVAVAMRRGPDAAIQAGPRVFALASQALG